MIESVAFLFRVPLPVGLSTVVVAPTTCSYYLFFYYLYYVGGLGEVSRENVGALGEKGPKECWCFRRGKLPLSHKPVEIGDFRAQSDSRGGEAGRSRTVP